MTVKELVFEESKDTAKKIRKEFKKVFPTSKFSITTSTNSVDVRWSGGETPDHQAARDLAETFSSTKFDAMTDYGDLTGYEYDGELFAGPDYIFYSKA